MADTFSFEEAVAPAKDNKKTFSFEEAAQAPKKQKEVPTVSKPMEGQSFLSNAANMFGGGEAALNMASGMIAKPISDIAGMAAMGKEMVSPTRGGGDPSGFKQSVQESLTYQPRTELGKVVAEYNPIALAGQAVGKVANVAGNVVGGNTLASSPRGMAGNLTREVLQQAPGLLGARNIGKGVVEKVLTPEQQAVATAQSKGYTLSPSIARPNFLNDFIEGNIIGKAKSEQGQSLKNEKLNSQMIKESLGIPEGEALNAESLHAVRENAGIPYEAIKQAVPTLVATKEYLTNIKDIKGNKYKAAVNEFPEYTKSADIEKLQRTLNRPRMSTEAAIDLAKLLRAEAKINKGFNKTVASDALGDAQINGANALDGLMLERLKKEGKQELYQKMQDSRKTIAQTYIVENALSGPNSVSARKVANAAKAAKKNGVLFTGPLADIAETYGNFPKSMQDMSAQGGSVSGSQLGSAAAIHAAASGHPLIAGLIATKGGLRNAFLSDWYQKKFASPPKPGPRNPSALNYGLIPPPPPNNDRGE